MSLNFGIKVRTPLMELEHIACFFDLAESEFDFLENKLKEYDIGTYTIAHEAEPKPHFHLLFEGTPQIYNAFSKVIVDKYKLRRKGRGGVIKYGKVKNIRNLERMLTYTLKDGNFRSNMDPEQLANYFKNSFKKVLKNELIDNIVQYIDGKIEESRDEDGYPQLLNFSSQVTDWLANIEDFRLDVIRPLIIDYLVDNDIKHTFSQMDNFIYQYLCRNTFFSKKEKKEIINAHFNYQKIKYSVRTI